MTTNNPYGHYTNKPYGHVIPTRERSEQERDLTYAEA